jgi:hypothetical protein
MVSDKISEFSTKPLISTNFADVAATYFAMLRYLVKTLRENVRNQKCWDSFAFGSREMAEIYYKDKDCEEMLTYLRECEIIKFLSFFSVVSEILSSLSLLPRDVPNSKLQVSLR